ncbi:hypothetical protein [Priestia megaterium]|uniref:hypothetical protein n=1 Tax=Priestia megaterium TaxID=1404 RepID=UPI000BFBB14D|nr:hypothetical protein [Priestia megaterium]PGX73139.1 hypothetical protein COE31_23540 [Priestia megaterium]
MARKTNEQYLAELKEKQIRVIPLDPYQGARVKIKHQCECGGVWAIAPTNVFKGTKCGCGINKNTHKQYIEKLKEKQIKVIPLENYRGEKVKIKHQCICQNIWEIRPSSVLAGMQCGCGKKPLHEQYLKKLINKDIKTLPLEGYKDSKTKILHRCICGNEYMCSPKHVLAGIKCGCGTQLAGQNRKKTHEQYLKQLEEKSIKVLPLEPYKNNTTRILHLCTCGTEWMVFPTSVLQGKKCGCKKYKMGSNTEYLQALQDKRIDVVPLEEFKGFGKKIKHRCICGNIWKTTPSIILEGYKCGCRFQRTHSHEEYLEALKVRKIEVVPLEQYQGIKKKILHRCVCGNEWNATPPTILSGNRCGCRARKQRKEHDVYVNELKEKKILVEPLENYITGAKKILHKCICGNTWNVAPFGVLSGSLCGCKYSNGEMIIRTYLVEQGIPFKQEVSFSGLEGKKGKFLRYDFGIYSKNKLLALIEYHGEQHFRFIKKWHKTKGIFEEQKRRDDRKRQYAKKKSIPLIEITYKDKDIISILEKRLSQIKVSIQTSLFQEGALNPPQVRQQKPKKCQVEGCGRGGQITKGFCEMHYTRFRRYKDPLFVKLDKHTKICTVEGCNERVSGRGYCRKHYNQWKRQKDSINKKNNSIN